MGTRLHCRWCLGLIGAVTRLVVDELVVLVMRLMSGKWWL